MSFYCQTITQKHQTLLDLKTQFDLTFSKAKEAGNLTECQSIKKQMEGIISYLKEITQDPCKTLKLLPEQIAHNEQEITPDTKAYVGQLYPNIFKHLSHVDSIYTSFPEGLIKKETITTGGKTKEQLINELKELNIQVYSGLEFLMNSNDFSTSSESEQVDFVRLMVKDLFNDTEKHTIDEIYAKAKELDLELCQSQDGPNYRLHYKDQPQGESIFIGIKQISDAGGDPRVFGLNHHAGGLELEAYGPLPGHQWDSDNRFAFRLSKYEP